MSYHCDNLFVYLLTGLALKGAQEEPLLISTTVFVLHVYLITVMVLHFIVPA